MKYKKPQLTYAQHLELLKSRGLIINDDNEVLQTLTTITYYRLSAYMFPFKERVKGNIIDKFRKGTKWDNVIDLYDFDRKLRILVFDTIERIEIALRTQIVQNLSEKYGSHWQDKPEIFKIETKKSRNKKDIDNGNRARKTIDVYKELQEHIRENFDKPRPAVFIRHYKEKYDSPKNPPSWMCSELFYFKHLSLICSHLKDRSDLTSISRFFDLPPKIFLSWLHTINSLRNICTHHSRLYNREIDILPYLLDNSDNHIWLNNPKGIDRSKIYYSFCIINYFLQTIDPKHPFKTKLKSLIKDYEQTIYSPAMGFPEKWETEKIWE